MRNAATGEDVTYNAGRYFVGEEEVEVTPGPITINDQIWDDEGNRMIPIAGAQRYHTTPTNGKVEQGLRGHGFVKLQPWGQPYLEHYTDSQTFQVGRR